MQICYFFTNGTKKKTQKTIFYNFPAVEANAFLDFRPSFKM